MVFFSPDENIVFYVAPEPQVTNQKTIFNLPTEKQTNKSMWRTKCSRWWWFDNVRLFLMHFFARVSAIFFSLCFNHHNEFSTLVFLIPKKRNQHRNKIICSITRRKVSSASNLTQSNCTFPICRGQWFFWMRACVRAFGTFRSALIDFN